MALIRDVMPAFDRLRRPGSRKTQNLLAPTWTGRLGVAGGPKLRLAQGPHQEAEGVVDLSGLHRAKGKLNRGAEGRRRDRQQDHIDDGGGEESHH